MPMLPAVQDRVAVPEPGIANGVIAPHERPGGAVNPSETVIEKWFKEATVTVVVAGVLG